MDQPDGIMNHVSYYISIDPGCSACKVNTRSGRSHCQLCLVCSKLKKAIKKCQQVDNDWLKVGRASIVAIQDLVQSTFYPRRLSVEARRSGGEVQCRQLGQAPPGAAGQLSQLGPSSCPHTAAAQLDNLAGVACLDFMDSTERGSWPWPGHSLHSLCCWLLLNWSNKRKFLKSKVVF